MKLFSQVPVQEGVNKEIIKRGKKRDKFLYLVASCLTSIYNDNRRS